MPAPKLIKRNKSCKVYFTEEELLQIQALAANANKPTSELIRDSLLAKRNIVVVPPINFQAYSKLCELVGILKSANQLTPDLEQQIINLVPELTGKSIE